MHIKPLLPIIALLLTASCTHTRYIPLTTQEHSRDTLRLTTIRHDTTAIRDSIHIIERAHGDTIYITRDRYHFRDRAQIIHDTIRSIHRDTIVKPTLIPATDTPRPTWRDKIKSAIILLLSLIFITFVITSHKQK